MFVDSIKKLQNISYTGIVSRANDIYGQEGYGNDMSGRQMDVVKASINKSEYYKEKFFAQRNMYLTGFTLFLCFMILRTIQITNELLNGIAVENSVADVKSSASEDELRIKIAEYEEKIDDLSKKILLEDETI